MKSIIKHVNKKLIIDNTSVLNGTRSQLSIVRWPKASSAKKWEDQFSCNSIQVFFCGNWSSYDAPTWHHFSCSLKNIDVGYGYKSQGFTIWNQYKSAAGQHRNAEKCSSLNPFTKCSCRHQNSVLCYRPSMSRKQQFSSCPNRQTDRQTDRQIERYCKPIGLITSLILSKEI